MQENRDTTPQQDTITLGWALFEAIPECVKLLATDGMVLAINRNGLRSMDIEDAGTVRGHPWSALWPNESHAAIEAALDAARAGGTGHFRAACPTVKGVPKWWDVMVTRTAAVDGQQPRLLALSRDITEQMRLDAERRQAERALHASRERFEKIVSQASTGVVQMDTAGRIVLANQKYCEMVGRSEAELLGLDVAEVTAPQWRAATREALAHLAAGGGVALDKSYLRRDGSEVSATSSVNALRGPDGEFEGLVAIVLDTTERKLVQEQLRASEERYRTLFESVDQGFCIFEMIFDDAGKAVDYRFLEMNPMFERHTGLVDAVGRTAREMLPALDEFWFETYGRVALTGEAARFENEAPAMGRWFDVYANRIGGEESRKVALLFSDVSARKQSEEELRRLADDLAEADRRKTEFLATLAHELRNPLAPIRNGLSVMRLGGDNPAAVAKVREMMERQVGHMVHLIDDLLDVARISGGKLELKRQRADLRTILASAVETSLPLIEAGQHALEVDLPELPLLVDADATRIAQVVANLLNNAAKYTPPRGRIRLSVRREGNEAAIAVSDTGVGIAGDALAGVFDMFSQIGRTVDRAGRPRHRPVAGAAPGRDAWRERGGREWWRECRQRVHGAPAAGGTRRRPGRAPAGRTGAGARRRRRPEGAGGGRQRGRRGDPVDDPGVDGLRHPGGARRLPGAGAGARLSSARRLPRHRHAGHERLRGGARAAHHGRTGGNRAGGPDRLGRRERPPALGRGRLRPPSHQAGAAGRGGGFAGEIVTPGRVGGFAANPTCVSIHLPGRRSAARRWA